MRSAVLFTLGLFFTFSLGRAQTDRDSAMTTEVRTAFKTAPQKPDSSLAVAERALLRSRLSGNKKLAAFGYKTRGWAFYHKGIYDSAFPDLLRSTELFRQLQETKEELYMYLNLSMAYASRSNFIRCARYMLLADSLVQKIDDIRVRAAVKKQMAILYREQGQYPKAIAYFRESLLLFRSAKDTVGIFEAITSLCLVYKGMSLPDSSLSVLRLCAPLHEYLEKHNYSEAMLGERYGDVYFALYRYNEALENYSHAFTTFAGNNDKADMAYEAMNVGKTYARLKNYRKAEDYLLLSYRLNDSLKIVNYLLDVAAEMAELYKVTGNWNKAFDWLEKSKSLQDSLQLVDQNEKTAQLQAQYEAEKKDKEISLLKKDQELNRAIVQRQKAVQYGAVALVGLLVIISFLIITRYRWSQKAKRQIELEKMRNNIARDLHDDMGSALSSINIISKVAMENREEKINLDQYLKRIHDNSGYILEHMADIVWTINPANDSIEMIIFKIKEFSAGILDPLNIPYEFIEEGDFRDLKLELQIRKGLYLIFKEAINNAAKYSAATRIEIRIAGKDRQIECQVRDNGRGFDMNNARNGNGLRNMKERAARIDAHLTVSSEPGKGTLVRWTIRSHH